MDETAGDVCSNFQRAWAMFDQRTLDASMAPRDFRACLFGLCFFHSLLVDRARFGILGWSLPHEVGSEDLHVCAHILRNYWDKSASPLPRGAHRQSPWQELRHLVGEVVYGGHMLDFFGRRAIMSFLEVSSST